LLSRELWFNASARRAASSSGKPHHRLNFGAAVGKSA
jgi:hypothetical protein